MNHASRQLERSTSKFTKVHLRRRQRHRQSSLNMAPLNAPNRPEFVRRAVNIVLRLIIEKPKLPWWA